MHIHHLTIMSAKDVIEVEDNQNASNNTLQWFYILITQRHAKVKTRRWGSLHISSTGNSVNRSERKDLLAFDFLCQHQKLTGEKLLDTNLFLQKIKENRNTNT